METMGPEFTGSLAMELMHVPVVGADSAALWTSPVPLSLGWSSPALLPLSDLLLCLGGKLPGVPSKILAQVGRRGGG